MRRAGAVAAVLGVDGDLLGGLLDKAAGKTFGKVGSAATGMAFSFATTYALGPAKQMQTQYLPQIQQKAATLDADQVMALMRGTA